MYILSIFTLIFFQLNIIANTSRIEGIVILDSDLEELRQLRLDLLLEKKEELAREGNWSEQDLIDFANQINAKSYGQMKDYVAKRLKRIKVNSIIAKGDRLIENLKNVEFTHYLKFNFDLTVTEGNIILKTKYELFDHTGKRIEIENDQQFFKQIKNLNNGP